MSSAVDAEWASGETLVIVRILTVSFVATLMLSGCGAGANNAAIEACADIYRYNGNSDRPGQWEAEHDLSGARMRAAKRLDGSPILHNGAQVYNVAIPKYGETVRFNDFGFSEGAAGCQMYQDGSSGSWRSANGM